MTKIRSTAKAADTQGDDSRYRAPALDKGLDIIELLAATEEGLVQADIAKALGRSANEIFRMLDRLQRRGYVRRSGDRYDLSLKLFALTHQHAPIRRLVSLATPFLGELSRRIQQSCHIAVYDQGHVVVIAQSESPGYYGLSIRVGSRIGLFNTGSGHVLLAFASESEREMMMREHALVPGETRGLDLSARLDEVRRHGYEQMDSQQTRSVVNLSAPILGPNGIALAALTVPFLSPLEDKQLPEMPAVLGLLRAAATELSQFTGGKPRRIDTHCHLVYRQRLDYPWLSEVPPLDRDFLLEDYLPQARAAGVTDCVFVEVDVHESQMEQEAAFAGSLGGPIVGVVAACRPESAVFPAYLERIAASPLVKGLRRVLHTQPDALSQQARFAVNLRRIAAHGLSFDLCVRAPQLPLARSLAQKCPDVQFVLDHCGNPDLRSGKLSRWRAEIRALAALPNVACKLSGVMTQMDPQSWSVDHLRPVFEHVIACFGWERVLWGSDWPVCTLTAPLGRWMDCTEQLMAEASQDESAQLYSRNAARIYRTA